LSKKEARAGGFRVGGLGGFVEGLEALGALGGFREFRDLAGSLSGFVGFDRTKD
jgi:hypothetical protein